MPVMYQTGDYPIFMTRRHVAAVGLCMMVASTSDILSAESYKYFRWSALSQSEESS